MAVDKKISELTAYTSLQDNDLFAVVDVANNITKKIEATYIKSYLSVSVQNTRIAFGDVNSKITSSASLTFDGSKVDTPAISINGTAGAGYVNLVTQSANPTSVNTAARLFGYAQLRESLICRA
jgi:hypothetical protein